MRLRMTVAAVGAAAILVVPAAAAAAPGKSSRRVCSQATAGHAACLARVVTSARTNKPLARPRAATPSGYFPADLENAYKLPSSTAGAGQTIGIVDAFDDPNAESDLATYRSQFGLPPCTTANGCFRKVNQNGAASPLPAADTGWAQEISLDLDMASAICPNCHILLVEANSSSFANLATAVNTAAAPRRRRRSPTATAGREFTSRDVVDDSALQPPGHRDHRLLRATPASASSTRPRRSYVTAVGGTSLRRDGEHARLHRDAPGRAPAGLLGLRAPSRRGSTTPAARGAPSPTCRRSPTRHRRRRLRLTRYLGSSGWLVFGGTSVAAPIIAGVYALAGAAAPSFPYAHTASLFDVTCGSNGSLRRHVPVHGRGRLRRPTGLGTPNGAGAF